MIGTKHGKQSGRAWKPHGYQKKAIKFGLQNSCAAFFLDPGLGKTSILLAIIKMLKKEGLIDKALIIAPLRVVYSVWPKEIEKWSDFSGLSYEILHGKDKERAYARDADIYLVNPEGLSWLFGHKDFKKRGFGLLGIDESTKFKSTSSLRFKILKNQLDYFARRYILTGTPTPNGYMDLFGQIYLLDQGAALGRYITHYRNRFFYPSGFQGYDWKLQKGAEKQIQDAVRPIALRMDAADYLELPEIIVNDIYVDLPPEAREVYKEMEDELVAALEGNDIVAVSAAVASAKCSQMANGGIYDEHGVAYRIHDEKSEALSSLIEELNGSPALVAYEYNHDLIRLRGVLGKDVPFIGGGVTPKRSAALERMWNAGELPVLLGQPASIAHGLNLQNAGNHVVWHSLTWNFEYYDQFNRRVFRQGNQHKHVFIHRIIARDTVDEIKIQAMNNKFRGQKDLFDALNSFLRKKR